MARESRWLRRLQRRVQNLLYLGVTLNALTRDGWRKDYVSNGRQEHYGWFKRCFVEDGTVAVIVTAAIHANHKDQKPDFETRNRKDILLPKRIALTLHQDPEYRFLSVQ